jgi:hypothetical protein
VCMTSLAALSVIPSGAAAATGKPLKFCFMFLGQRLNFPHFLTIAVHYTLHAQCLQATLVISAGRELPQTTHSGARCVRSTHALTHPLRFTLADTATSLDVEAFSHYSAMPLPRTTRSTFPNLPLAPRRNKFLRPTRTSSAYSSPRETATW